MKNPTGTKRGRLVIQGSTLSFKGRTHQEGGESAWKANQCLLMIWVNCSEDGWTSVLICRPLQSPLLEVLYSKRVLPLLSRSDWPLSLWVIQSFLDGNLFTLCSACEVTDIAGGREVILCGEISELAVCYFPPHQLKLYCAVLQFECNICWVLIAQYMCVLWCLHCYVFSLSLCECVGMSASK